MARLAERKPDDLHHAENPRGDAARLRWTATRAVGAPVASGPAHPGTGAS